MLYIITREEVVRRQVEYVLEADTDEQAKEKIDNGEYRTRSILASGHDENLEPVPKEELLSSSYIEIVHE